MEKATDKNVAKIEEISLNNNSKEKTTILEFKYMKLKELLKATANFIFKLAVSPPGLP